MRILFMGTPDFAVASLEALHKAGHDIAAVVTAPDRPAGRGRKLKASAVKEYAFEKDFKVLQPVKLKDPEFLHELSTLNADLAVVVAFRMLPKEVWQMPRLGTINLHGSLLPQYRGAAPINWAIINGESQTGVTTFFINENIDTGAMIMQRQVEITKQDNAGSLHDKLMATGAGLLVDTLDAIEKDNAPRQEQDHSQASKSAPKIFKEDTRIDFSKTLKEVYDFIRGLSPYPTAISTLHQQDEELPVKIFAATQAENTSEAGIGKVASDNKNSLEIRCKDGWISIDELQPSGKKRMKIKEFLNGHQILENAQMR